MGVMFRGHSCAEVQQKHFQSTTTSSFFGLSKRRIREMRKELSMGLVNDA
jgi:hypothetical protein